MRNHAYIDLNALRVNARKIKKRLPRGVKLCAVVKADAYGHGACRVAKALFGIADRLAVALPEEGRELRYAGERREILVLSALQQGDEDPVVRHGLTATVCERADVFRLQNACEAQGKTVCVHVKLNTGMNRLGADGKTLDGLLAAFADCPLVRLTGVYSHLADPCDEEFTAAQTALFDLLCARVKAVAPDATVHLSASGGFLKGLYYDMVRIGILLYGYAPFPSAFSCRPIMRVTAPVIACRYVRRAERVFYGKQLKQKSGYLSVLRYGYADGLPRSDGFFRCMDASAVEKREKIGKECDILKKNANEIAQKCGTINYEVLVNAARRAEKIYLE